MKIGDVYYDVFIDSGENLYIAYDADDPELVNKDPYGKGWMIKIKVADAAELDELMDADAYKAMIEA